MHTIKIFFALTIYKSIINPKNVCMRITVVCFVCAYVCPLMYLLAAISFIYSSNMHNSSPPYVQMFVDLCIQLIRCLILKNSIFDAFCLRKTYQELFIHRKLNQIVTLEK